MKHRFVVTLLLTSLCLASVVTHAQTPDPVLVGLRERFAAKYMEPRAHYELAKYFLDKGEHLQAFSILEYARRYRFEEKEFDSSYATFFGDPMPEPPDDAKKAFEAASHFQEQRNYQEAERFYLKAVQIDPRSFYMNAWVGRFYYRTRSDSARALPFYFKAYFLYPHAYETEFVESRIAKISIENADREFPELLRMGKTLVQLSNDRNPLIANKAIEKMAEGWKPEYMKILLECMSHDDSGVRYLAFMTVKEKAGSQLDEVLTSLLDDKDQRKRGLATYGIVERWNKKGLDILAKMLTEPNELIRFDALSALALKGGSEGRRILKEHLPHERNEKLRFLINRTVNEK